MAVSIAVISLSSAWVGPSCGLEKGRWAARRAARPLLEGDLVHRLLDLVDDHVGQLGALLAVQSLT